MPLVCVWATNPNMEDRIMKAKVYLLAIGLMMIAGKSSATSGFMLTNLEGSHIYVVFSGDVFYPESSRFELFDVAPGRHSLEVYRYSRDSRGFYTRNAMLVYRGAVTLGKRERVTGQLTADGRLVITGRVPVKPSTPGKGKSGYNSHGNSGYNSHGKSGYSSRGNSGYNSHGTSGYSPDYSSSAMFSVPEFNRLLITLSEASFEQTRLLIAREAVASRVLTAEQVYMIMLRFSFESTKLEFAKFAYSRTMDKSSYFIVHRAFSFDSSKRELTRYISMYS